MLFISYLWCLQLLERNFNQEQLRRGSVFQLTILLFLSKRQAADLIFHKLFDKYLGLHLNVLQLLKLYFQMTMRGLALNKANKILSLEAYLKEFQYLSYWQLKTKSYFLVDEILCCYWFLQPSKTFAQKESTKMPILVQKETDLESL